MSTARPASTAAAEPEDPLSARFVRDEKRRENVFPRAAFWDSVDDTVSASDQSDGGGGGR